MRNYYSDYFDRRDMREICWQANIMLFCGVAMVGITVLCLLMRACERVPAVTTAAVAAVERPPMAEVYPDPVCEFCGQVLDGTESCACPGHE